MPYYTMPFVDGASLRARLDARRTAAARRSDRTFCATSRRRSPTRTRTAWCIATSSRRTCCSPAARRWSSTSASRRRSSTSRTQRRQRDSPTTLERTLTSVGNVARHAGVHGAGAERSASTVDLRADLYAWGVMAYELLTGAHPFAGRTTAAAARRGAHRRTAGAARRKESGDLPSALANLVMRCLAKDPDDRPRSASEIARRARRTGDLRRSSVSPPCAARDGATVARVAALAAVLVLVAPAPAWAGALARARRQPATRHRRSPCCRSRISAAIRPREYLADGMTGELSNALQERCRVSKYRGRPVDVPLQGHAHRARARSRASSASACC